MVDSEDDCGCAATATAAAAAARAFGVDMMPNGCRTAATEDDSMTAAAAECTASAFTDL